MSAPRFHLEDHIATLGTFESRYREFLTERRGAERGWSDAEWANRERELKELAPQVEEAVAATGKRRWDEGPVRIDLPSRILAIVDPGDGIDDDEQWKILEEIPIHIGALKGKLRRVPNRSLEIEDGPPPVGGAAPQPPVGRNVQVWIGEQAGKIAIGVITGLILAGVLFLIKGGL
jgi:hypothetical protein